MQLEGRVIYLISPEAWGEHMLSKHQFAVELARRDNEVYFIEPPYGFSTRVREVGPTGGIHALPWKPARGIAKLPSAIARKIQQTEWSKIVSLTGAIPELVWSFDNSRFFDLDAVPQGCKSIHHVVDLNQDFQLERAAKSANLCLATTAFIASRLKAHNPNTHDIGHACHPVPHRPKTAYHSPRKQVYYTGNLLIPLIDHYRILSAIESRTDCDFHFLGAYSPSNLSKSISREAAKFIERLQQETHVTLHGALSGHAYHEALNRADVFIIAYQQDAYAQVANPHKVPELLSTGSPIVSNVLDSYTDKDLLYMADDHETWMSLLNFCLDRYEDANSEKKREQRRHWAFQRTYTQQVNLVEELLK